MSEIPFRDGDTDREETRDWLASLDDVIARSGPDRAVRLLRELSIRAHERGLRMPFTANTPYINTIPRAEQPPYPGNRELERRVKSIVRWNAMAMVVRANREEEGIGGHISTYASAATLYEVGFNHFFRGPTETFPGDLIYFQGHAAPGIYARAFLEGRLSADQLANFRHELHATPGLSSYPHPWLMPDFWQFPTVSMGLGPIMAIYQARFIRYVEDRGLRPPADQRVWAFLGDGETDEPETLGAITLASRERLDNLIFVINCNLQRLDGPVRGNGKIIQELEATFRGAGWNVIKVIWGGDWDPLLEQDREGVLVRRMTEVVDGEYQRYVVADGAYIRRHFFGADPRLIEMVRNLSDEQLQKMRRGGHDPEKVYAAYAAAVAHRGSPTVILAKTIKGYGLGEAGEGRNITHQQKKLNEDELRQFRNRFGIPISDDEVARLPFYRPPEGSPEMQYLRERRAALGGHVPARRVAVASLTPPRDVFEEFRHGSDRPVSTTMVFVRLLTKLLRDSDFGRWIVPIVPDEARTFGMEALFRQSGIYSHPGQLYEPVDRESLLYYKEARDGQILEEGITEAGSMSSFIAAGTAYANHRLPTIPFFIYYSMFGMQRVGDLVWAAGDSRCRGFMVGGTAGRTTLAGEGLQHQDGHSHLLALPVSNLECYDPAFAFELAAIVEEGLRRMCAAGESVFYYLTVMNENYPQPPMPDGVADGVLRGLYRFRGAEGGKTRPRVRLVGSGAILNEALRAADWLHAEAGVAAEVWSATSYKRLHREAAECERWNRLHPGEPPRQPYVAHCLPADGGPVIAASDYMKALPDMVARYTGGRWWTLGTDGFGRSDGRAALRRHFEVDAGHIAVAALAALAAEGRTTPQAVRRAIEYWKIDAEAPDPWTT